MGVEEERREKLGGWWLFERVNRCKRFSILFFIVRGLRFVNWISFECMRVQLGI